jgi:hypothetical protein
LPLGSGSDGIEQVTRVSPGASMVSLPGFSRKMGVAAPSVMPR